MTGSRSIHAARSSKAPSRLSMSDKHAIVSRLRRLGGNGQPLGAHVRAVAAQHDVSVKTVYKWLKDPAFSGAEPPKKSRRRFEVTVEHLTVVAQEQNLFSAWEKMKTAGLVDCSYSTFARAIGTRTDPTLVAAALDGYKGLVNKRLYLKWTPPHRCHTYHVDHTKMDLWVWPSHKHRSPVRPHVTVIVDGATGLLHAVPWVGDINGDMIAAALVDCAVEHDYFDVPVGGTPEQVILDNAAAHFGPAMRAAVERVGWIPAPTAAYSSWQNGKAERAIGLLNARLSNRAPGATNSGTTRTGAPRNVARLPADINPEDVWSWKAFKVALQAEVDDINTAVKVKRLGGLTRLEAYAADPTERRPLPGSEARLAMLTSDGRTYTATKNGINFDGIDYVDGCLEYGRKYLIRYLPTQRGFIEVFDLNDEHVGTAYDPDRIPKNRRDEFMAERARQERDAQAIEYGVRAHRRHLAAVDNAGVGYEDAAPDNRLTTEPATPDSAADSGTPTPPTDANTTPLAVVPTPEPVCEPVASAVERLDRAHGENAPERATPSRSRQPRVPATPPPSKDNATQSAMARLAAEHGDSLKVAVTKKTRTNRANNPKEKS